MKSLVEPLGRHVSSSGSSRDVLVPLRVVATEERIGPLNRGPSRIDNENPAIAQNNMGNRGYPWFLLVSQEVDRPSAMEFTNLTIL